MRNVRCALSLLPLPLLLPPPSLAENKRFYFYPVALHFYYSRDSTRSGVRETAKYRRLVDIKSDENSRIVAMILCIDHPTRMNHRDLSSADDFFGVDARQETARNRHRRKEQRSRSTCIYRVITISRYRYLSPSLPLLLANLEDWPSQSAFLSDKAK